MPAEMHDELAASDSSLTSHASHDSRPLIHLDHVGMTYRSGVLEVRALDDISLSIAHGEFVAIVGQSGSGKTTLLDILGCLNRPTEGRYRLDGRAVESLDDAELARVRNRHIGFVFQAFHLLPRKTALQNVELPLHYTGVPSAERRERALEALRLVGLSDRVTHQPNELSGGQQQRVAIARALVNRPDLLLADEPTGSLDTRSGQEILDLLLDRHRHGQAVVLVTHERRLAEAADRIITLSDGRVVSDERTGPAAALTVEAGRPGR
jgi:putative ABC transport system ATP-binding protein